ncbi:MAG: PEFG-CTERM sorting domain-containing protein [Candidatus Nitrosotalea sp.]|nr:PEFG-CTERM sorting domain-containing protein [Candidatus Nitrosotalea sp.]
MNRKIIIPAILALVAVIIAPYALHPAEAHTLKTFDKVSVKIGWLHEPPFVGDLNEVDVYVYNGTDDTAPPIAGTALDKLTVTAQYGGNTKNLSFDASDDTPGLYVSALTPAQIGTYNMIIQGSINGTTIPSTTYAMQDVEAKDNYYFPPMSGNMTGMNMSSNMTGMNMSNNTVPEFGPIASLVLVIAIVSVIVVTGKSRGFLNF